MKSLFAAALLLVSANSMAAVIKVVNLGGLDVPSITSLSNSFSSAGTYEDQYKFSISQSASASGLVLELDPTFLGLDLNRLDIGVTGISLKGSSGLIGYDASAKSYNFGLLGAGSYTLSIFSTVSSEFGLWNSNVGYQGSLSLGATRPTTQVPEPGTLALFGLALVGTALAMRRKAVRN